MRVARPLKPITQIVIIIFVTVGGAIFIMNNILPNIESQSQKVTEEVTITSSSRGLCQVNTSDESIPTKTIPNCDLEEGTKVMISHQKGFPFAKIASSE